MPCATARRPPTRPDRPAAAPPPPVGSDEGRVAVRIATGDLGDFTIYLTTQVTGRCDKFSDLFLFISVTWVTWVTHDKCLYIRAEKNRSVATGRMMELISPCARARVLPESPKSRGQMSNGVA